MIRNVPQAIYLRDKCFSMFCSRIVSKNGWLVDLCSIFTGLMYRTADKFSYGLDALAPVICFV